MTSLYQVAFSPESQAQISDLYHYIAQAGSPQAALEYTEAILSHCEALSRFPERGTLRSDIRPGLRTTHYRGRVIIAYTLLQDTVHILCIYYGGQDFQTMLSA